MASWADLEREAPTLAAEGRRLLHAGGHGEAFLATVRDGEPPRIHPISVGIVDGTLYAFIGASPKRTDLERDGRYALHSHLDRTAPDELALRGRARLISDAATRGPIAAGWSFEPDETYLLFAFDIDSAIVGRRAADEWPPRYERWPAAR
jgi:hypothetical protein